MIKFLKNLFKSKNPYQHLDVAQWEILEANAKARLLHNRRERNSCFLSTCPAETAAYFAGVKHG